MADANNNIGIAGIASNTLLMTISDNGSGNSLDDQWEIALGIGFAENNGADVINCSWYISVVSSSVIGNAINDALDDGRDGLGCVFVFGAGNFNEDEVLFPANSYPDLITVGAINQKGMRKTPSSWDGEDTWGSNYGDDLDVVAPGVLIPTLDLTGSYGYNPNDPLHENANGTLVSSDYMDDDYTIQFNGTSSATPHVSGVAALILSANNGLSHDEVEDIIELTANKINPTTYTYSSKTGRNNGNWNKYMGYGLVDAGAAVESAVCDHTIENTRYSSDITISGCSNVDMENIIVEDDAILTIEDVGSILISGTFEAEIGTQLVFDP
ncbi:MAG: S8 family serine peptidase [Bacteroidota bacterium]